MTVQIINGDCLEELRKLPAESVHCVVTSPPYWGLRDYGNEDGGIGLEDTLQEHVEQIVAVFAEVWRVLRKDGTVWLNYGSSYASADNVGACGISGKELRDYRENGYPSVSLCGECRASQTHRIPGNDALPALSPSGAPSGQTRGNTERLPARLATLGLADPPFSRRAALDIPGSHIVPAADGTSLRGSQVSNIPQSSRPLPGVSTLAHNQAALVSPSAQPPSSDDAQGCADKDCAPSEKDARTAGTARPFGPRVRRNQRTSGYCSQCGAWSDDLRSNIIDPLCTTATIKAKDDMMLPARIAIALQDAGWWVRSEIIWAKPNPMPESVTDRPTSAHEKIYLLTKSQRYFYDAEAVRETSVYGPGEGGHQRFGAPGGKQMQARNGERLSGEIWHGTGRRNLRNVWTIATAPYSQAHFATFPPALVEPCIKAGTSEKGVCAECGAPWVRMMEREYMPNPGHHWGPRGDASRQADKRSDLPPNSLKPITKTIGWSPSCACGADVVPATVLDPFGGAGTTGLVAAKLGRDAILIEMNADYCGMIERRLKAALLPTEGHSAEPDDHGPLFESLEA